MIEYLARELGSKTKWIYSDVCRAIPDRRIAQLNDLKAQAKEVIKQDPRKYENWANILAKNIEKINQAFIVSNRNGTNILMKPMLINSN